MSTPAMTRESVENAEPIDFEAKRTAALSPRAYPARSYAIAVVSPAGYQITITLNDIRLDALDDALSTLIERGYLPYEPAAPNPTPAATSAAPQTPPVCPYHGPMKESDKRPGTYYCPKKMADNSGYCKEKWPK